MIICIVVVAMCSRKLALPSGHSRLARNMVALEVSRRGREDHMCAVFAQVDYSQMLGSPNRAFSALVNLRQQAVPKLVNKLRTLWIFYERYPGIGIR